jgi:hypothetical protein
MILVGGSRHVMRDYPSYPSLYLFAAVLVSLSSVVFLSFSTKIRLRI